MISIGEVVGGPECKYFDAHVRRLMRYCQEHRSQGYQLAEVNVVYHLPGSIVKPDYVGVRTGRFSKEEKTLMIQVSIEPQWIALSDSKTVIQVIYETADEALGLAKTEFDKRGVKYDLDTDRILLDSWKATEVL